MAGATTPIIDTHTHVVSPDEARYPRLGTGPASSVAWLTEQPVDAACLLADLDAGGVHGAVVVQPHGAYAYDNRYVAEARRLAPDRLVAVSIIDVAAPDRLEALRRWAAAGMGGTRLFNIPPADPPWLGAEAGAAVVEEARALGVRLGVCVLPSDLHRVEALLLQAGDVPVALDHCGFADVRDLRSPTGQALVRLARFPGIRCKVTTTLLHGAGGDPRDLLEGLCEVFGADRLMWGSDYPQHHERPYPELVDEARHACSRLSPDEQAAYLGGTALALWPELRPPA
jgi:predicted TIM-barrel fold metal-dependent hydrolase